jgi:hypothetical protein
MMYVCLILVLGSVEAITGYEKTQKSEVGCGPAGCLTDTSGKYGCTNQRWGGTQQCMWMGGSMDINTTAAAAASNCSNWVQCRAFYCQVMPPCPNCSPSRPASTWCFARGTDGVEPSTEPTAEAFVKKAPGPPPAPGPPTPVDAWADKVACTYVASAVPGMAACNGWSAASDDDTPGMTPKLCVAKCAANEIPAGCPPIANFHCKYAQWEPSDTDDDRCQVAGSRCTPVANPDIWHPAASPGGSGWTQLGANVWKMTSCVLKPGEPKGFAPACAACRNKTACTNYNQTCKWEDPTVLGLGGAGVG